MRMSSRNSIGNCASMRFAANDRAQCTVYACCHMTWAFRITKLSNMMCVTPPDMPLCWCAIVGDRMCDTAQPGEQSQVCTMHVQAVCS
jgi:hypothetical protein